MQEVAIHTIASNILLIQISKIRHVSIYDSFNENQFNAINSMRVILFGFKIFQVLISQSMLSYFEKHSTQQRGRTFNYNNYYLNTLIYI